MARDCGNCKYFDRIGGDGREDEDGFCRRFAPRPKTAPRDAMTDSAYDVVAWWPSVMVDDWCGEFEAVE